MLGHVRPSVLTTNSHVEYRKDFGASYLSPRAIFGPGIRPYFGASDEGTLLRETLMYI